MYLIFWIAYTSSTLLFVASSKFILVRGLARIESVPGRFDEVVEAHEMTIVDEDLDDKGLPITTILAGEDIHGEECKEIGGKNLIITNYLNQNQVANLMNICDLFVFPSLY